MWYISYKNFSEKHIENVILALTHWGRVTQICIGETTIIDLGQVMVCHLVGAKPLSEPVMECY